MLFDPPHLPSVCVPIPKPHIHLAYFFFSRSFPFSVKTIFRPLARERYPRTHERRTSLYLVFSTRHHVAVANPNSRSTGVPGPTPLVAARTHALHARPVLIATDGKISQKRPCALGLLNLDIVNKIRCPAVGIPPKRVVPTVRQHCSRTSVYHSNWFDHLRGVRNSMNFVALPLRRIVVLSRHQRTPLFKLIYI